MGFNTIKGLPGAVNPPAEVQKAPPAMNRRERREVAFGLPEHRQARVAELEARPIVGRAKATMVLKARHEPTTPKAVAAVIARFIKTGRWE